MHDPILLKKIAKICVETDDVFWDGFQLALVNAAKAALSEWRPMEEQPQFVALMNECAGRVARGAEDPAGVLASPCSAERETANDPCAV